MNNDERIGEYDFLTKSFTESHKNHDIESLVKLIEHVRAEGILYQDFHEKNVKLLEDLFRISLDLLKDPVIHTSDRPWWFIMEVYDIVFHQVRMEKYSAICADLYFELSKEVLDNKFHKFYGRGRPDYMHYYSMCIYFILMSDNWFAGRKKEFLVLYKKLNPLIDDEPDHLEVPWINRHKELTTNRN